MKTKKTFIVLCLFIVTYALQAQTLDELRIPERNLGQPLDINSQAQELGITKEQLNGILSSVEKNGEGEPLPDALTERFFTGHAANDNFSYSVASAGDVNGDGYDDIIIGAPYNDAGGTDVGRAYLYFGSLNLNYLPDVIFSGAYQESHFGYSVSSAGDVNADGYDDIIIGAPTDIAGSYGVAIVIFGNTTMTTYSSLTLLDPAPINDDDLFGNSVSSAGDLNGDGYDDVIVGAPGHHINGTDGGAAFIFYGGSSMDANYDLSLLSDGPGSFGEFGGYVASAGDINGDGYEDAIVGATADVLVSVYLGGTSMNNIADLTVGGARGIKAGDLNGDGYSDIIVSDVPGAEIYFGGSILDNTPDLFISGTVADQFGSAIAGVGDVNGDGYDDVIVGAYAHDAGGTDAGGAYVYFGGVTMDNVKDIILTGKNAGDNFGFSVSGRGDFNGDGYSDILVGAIGNDANGTNSGRAYLYINSLTGNDIPDEQFKGESPLDSLGFSVSSAGDVNGDGYDDIVVGAPKNDAAGNGAGRAYIYFGGLSFDNIPDLILTGLHAGDEFGCSVSGAGDVNGDGFDDVIVGAWNDYNFGFYTGRAFIYYGGISMDNVADIWLSGEGYPDEGFGYSVASAGDVNADSYGDVIIGSISGINTAGKAYIYFGSSSMDGNPDVIFYGGATYDNFGKTVSTAGDVNADGYDDVIVGAPGYSGFTGRSYVFLGGSPMNNSADVIMTGAANDFFGTSVSSAGDVNADGYLDVIVGASSSDRAYIFYGGATMNNIYDRILNGEVNADQFGCSVSTAGDVNNDGYSDVIVGAYGNDINGFDAGRAYIYFGNQDIDDGVDITLTGQANFSNFGFSVSSGDLNKDGFSDVIVGASGTGANSAYLYISSSPPIKPRIMSVKDVPFDQGGQVFLNFVRSGYDAIGESNIITEYLIEMSKPPGVNGFSWWQAGTIQPVQNPLYTFVANTPNDSMTNNSGTYYFRITARTADPNVYWRSNIMYGHSVDNLAPLPPFNFYATLQTNQVKLGWKVNLEEDFRDYKIYRSDNPVSDAFTLLTTTTDTTFVDTSPLAGNAYYYVQAYDIHDNGSQLSRDSVMAFLSANIKVLLEGSYDAGGVMRTSLNLQGYIPLSQPFNTSPWFYTGTETVTSVPANVTDWILVELRITTTTVVDRRVAFIKNDGTLVDLDGVSNIKFPTATAGDYYVVIIHRNHLAVMTSTPITISFSPTLYDMRTDLSKAFGTNSMKSLVGGYYGTYTADTDGSGTVNATDRSNTWNQRNLSGYFGSDVDLSGTVNAGDRSLVWNNRNLSTQVPTPVDGPITEIVKENNK